MINRILLLTLLFFLPATGICEQPDTGDLKFSLAMIATRLTGPVAERHGEDAGLGVGAFFTYVNSKKLEFETGYLASSHNKLVHTEIPIGFNYKFEEKNGFLPYLASGVVLISNAFEDLGIAYKNSGFGVFGGGGVSGQLSRSILLDTQARYTYGFEQTVQRANGDKITALNSSVIAMVRVVYFVDLE